MSYWPQANVYGVLLNQRSEWAVLARHMNKPPHNSPPVAPVLYVKTANTWTASGQAIVMPQGVNELEVWASVAMVMGEGGSVAGYVLMHDLTVPHDFFRPPVRAKCMDGMLGLGPALTPVMDLPDLLGCEVEVRINGRSCHRTRCADMMKQPVALLAAISKFMTLHPGDALMLGSHVDRPLAKAGDRIEVLAEGMATLVNTLEAQP